LPGAASATDCGEAAPLSVMTPVAVSEPAAAGLNATYTLQVPAGARVAPQVFNSKKSVGLVPASAIELRPVFDQDE